MFKYGGIRKFFIKISIGLFFLFFSIFSLISLLTHNIGDPAIFSSNSPMIINNFFGLYGAYFSSFIHVFLNKIAYVPIIFCFYYGLKSSLGIITRLFFLKVLSLICSLILLSFSFSLIKYSTPLFGNILIDILIGFGMNLGVLTDGLKILIFVILFILSSFLLLFSFEFKFQKIKILNYFILLIFKIIKKIFTILNIFSILKVIKPSPKKYNLRNNKRTKSEPTISSTKSDNFKARSSDLVNSDNVAYELPPLDLLNKGNNKISSIKETEKNNEIVAEKLEKVLLEFGVEGEIINFKCGPVVTLFEFVPAPGIKNSKIVSLSNDIARSMSSLSARISSQPGKTSIGIEIPNNKREPVYFGDLVKEIEISSSDKIELALGKDISGQSVFADLKKMPHLLIAGTTGSGKSVGINSMIMSILYSFKPSECKLILIDPKMLELSIYEDIPHLLTPVVTNPNKAVFALKWVVREMENRYQIMSSINVKNIDSFNKKIQLNISSGRKLFREVQTGIDTESQKPIIEKKEIPLEKMPLIVVVVDEMADLMMVAGKEVENLIQRLAQMARASGIHLITATQRPSVDVITGTIKANFPSRISYRVASKFDSRTILNEMGAEQLLGSGDMLFLENGAYLRRLHGGFVSEKEIESVVRHIKEQTQSELKQDITMDRQEQNGTLGLDFEENGVDELYSQAVNIVIKNQKVSTSFIQRYLQIGYNRAARIVEKMEEDGIVSTSNNAGKRSVLKEK